MAMQIFNNDTVYNRKGKPATININTDGRLLFSVAAVNLLHIKDGDRISFAADNKDGGIVYYWKDANGIAVIKANKTKEGWQYLVCCRPLGKILCQVLRIPRARTYIVTTDTSTFMYEGNEIKAWFITKKKQHKPVKWKRK